MPAPLPSDVDDPSDQRSRPFAAARLHHIVEAGRALAVSARNRDLRLAQLSFAAGWTSEWLLLVAVGVVAFTAGGASQVAVIAALRMAIPALVAPVLSALSDRWRRDRILVWAGWLRGAAIAGGAGVVGAGGPLALTYALIVLAGCAFIVTRSANSALLPLLCTSPLELTSAVAARGAIDSLSMLLGPLAAAFLLGVSTPGVALLTAAALSVASGLALLPIRYEPPARPTGRLDLRTLVAETFGGFSTLARHRGAALLIGLIVVQTVIRGGLTVFVVVLSFEALDVGQAGVGFLTGAIGAGATVASLGALTLVGSCRLAAIQGLGVALWGLPLVLSAAFPESRPALLALMCVVGVGNALVDLGFFTVASRIVPESALGRVFGAAESLGALGVALGALGAPLLIDHLGLRAALILVGSIGPVAAAAALPLLIRIDRSMVRRNAEIAVLQRVRMLRPLPMPVIENLATHVFFTEVPHDTEVFRQGDVGDRFYVIAAGDVQVIVDGRVIAHLTVGDCFGEIALLRNAPRIATVCAESDLALYSLSRDAFLAAVAGCSASGREAESLLRGRMTAPVAAAIN